MRNIRSLTTARLLFTSIAVVATLPVLVLTIYSHHLSGQYSWNEIYQSMYSYVAWGAGIWIFTILLTIYSIHRITKPIRHLAGVTHKILHNDLQGTIPETKSNAPKEVHQLHSALKVLLDDLQESRQEVEQLNATLQQRIDKETQHLRETNAHLATMASSDHLTSLANRRSFEQVLSAKLQWRSNDVDNICIVLIDIDHFKEINDHYGHAAGDAVLAQVARILEGAMRSGDLVARYGGDEFVAQMRCTKEVGLQRAAEIRENIDNCAIPWQGKSIHTTVSVGLYCRELSEEIGVEKLLHEADIAMYEAKKKGRNTVVAITREMVEPA